MSVQQELETRCGPRDFREDLRFFLEKLRCGEPFALSRWGDGELSIILKRKLSFSATNGEFEYDPRDRGMHDARFRLEHALRFQAHNYFVGLPCPCCVGRRRHRRIKQLSAQSESALTWANLFVNSNYEPFRETYIPEFGRHRVVMVVNDRCQTERLPFAVDEVFKIGTNAWCHELEVITKLKELIAQTDMRGRLFLFAAGPLANTAVAELWQYNQHNTYLDIGSTLDVDMGLPATRRYQRREGTHLLKCVWSKGKPSLMTEFGDFVLNKWDEGRKDIRDLNR